MAWLTPLFHGVALTRGLSLGTIADDPVAALIHVVYLTASRWSGRGVDDPDDRRSRLVRG